MCTGHPATSIKKITIIERNSTSKIENETEQRKGKFPRIYIWDWSGWPEAPVSFLLGNCYLLLETYDFFTSYSIAKELSIY